MKPLMKSLIFIEIHGEPYRVILERIITDFMGNL